MTLLERWDMSQEGHPYITDDEIRRAIAIAQAVEEYAAEGSYWTVQQALRRADELLRGEK